MNNKYTYVGAFLQLRNIFTTKTIEVDACPKHGGSKPNTKEEFCPKCGSKIVKLPKEAKIRKSIWGDWDGKKEEWVDKMYIASTDVDQKEDFIILLPNQRKSGEVLGTFEDSPISIISDGTRDECLSILHKKYSDYIQWLTNVRGFEVSPKFGVVQYWN
jgi:hypothetical protein